MVYYQGEMARASILTRYDGPGKEGQPYGNEKHEASTSDRAPHGRAVCAEACATGHSESARTGLYAPQYHGEAISLSQFRGKKMVLLEFYGINFGTT